MLSLLQIKTLSVMQVIQSLITEYELEDIYKFHLFSIRSHGLKKKILET
jgi:hypothetical protein